MSERRFALRRVLALGTLLFGLMFAIAGMARAQEAAPSGLGNAPPPAPAGQAQPAPAQPGSRQTEPRQSGPAPPRTRAQSKLPSFDSQQPEEFAPVGSAFFSGEWITLEKLFETHEDPIPPGGAPWPDIAVPGPDMGDFPNSSFTLPKGRCYVEVAPLTLLNSDRNAPSAYYAPFLLRYGVTDDVEFRIFANGLVHAFGDQPTTGFSPLALDLKIHLWDDKQEWFLPASSLEVYLQTTWGSPQFNGGWQPSINMNFDLPLTEKTNLEWTVGYSGVQDAVNVVTGERFIPRFNLLVPTVQRANLNVNQFSIQWALEQDVTDRLQVFFHGFLNGAIQFQQGSGTMVGGGLFWKFSSRLIGFGSVNSGLTPTLPSVAVQLGFAYAL